MVYGFSPVGIMGRLVRVEVDLRRGLPGTDIVGLPSSEVKEARERVRVAIRNSGFEYPVDRILINMSPAEIPKVGAGFDLPIALAILARSGQITLPGNVLAIGELSIRGHTIPVRGTLSAILTAQEHRIGPVILPKRAERYVQGVSLNDSTILMVDTLRALRENGYIPFRDSSRNSSLPHRNGLSFDDMRGQAALKWASAVSAAGSHNVLFMGPPGSGKTMAARRIVSLLPDLGDAQTREVARIYSMRGIDGTHPRSRPPVRIPHHSATMEGILGGGKGNVPGEVSLAHRGLLILDEATEFKPQVLQSLREPVEAHRISISRAGRSEEFPAAFQLILTSNLCPCGKLGQKEGDCMCSVQEIGRYWRRMGEALLDRIDIRVRSHYQEKPVETISHAELVQKVHAAIERQERRIGVQGARNGLIPPETVASFLPLSRGLTALLQTRMRQLHLSDRAAASVRAMARTLADLDGRERVEAGDILEAAAFRAMGPEYLA